MKNTNNTRGLNELWEETTMNNNIEELIAQLTEEESNNEEENEMNEMNNNAGNSVNELQEETTMDQQMSLNEFVIETCFDEIGIDNEISMMTDEEWNEWTKENRRNYLERIKKERELDRRLEESYKSLEEIKERKERRKMAIKSVEIRRKALKSLKESAALAQQRGVEDEKILKNKTDIDNYFMSVDADTKDNYEEENEMNTNNNATDFNELWEEITVENEDTTEETVVEKTVEVEDEEGGFDASTLIHKGNILIACPSSLYAYKEAIVLLRDVEGAIDKTGSYTTKLSLESIKDGLMNLIAEYEDTSGMTSNKEQLVNRNTLANKIAGFKEVTAEKVSVLKEITSEKVSQTKTAIDNIDEDNEYYQKGVEVTEKAKAKYNEVLGNVFNRLKL